MPLIMQPAVSRRVAVGPTSIIVERTEACFEGVMAAIAAAVAAGSTFVVYVPTRRGGGGFVSFVSPPASYQPWF